MTSAVAMSVRIPQRDEAVARVRQGESVAVVGRHGKTRLLLELAAVVEGSIVVRVPAAPDQLPYLLLTIAAACGADVLSSVASSLSRRADDPGDALERLSAGLKGRALMVDDVDALGVRGIDPELRTAFRPAARAVKDWLATEARVRTFTESRDGGGIRPRPEVSDEGLRATWNRVGRDIDAFTVALLRERLVEVDSGEEFAWEPREIVLDVWDALPEALQEFVARLAVHGRPLARRDVIALGLSDEGSVEEAAEVGLVETGRDLVWLPKPWYAHCPAIAARDRARELHAELAKAFSGRVMGKDAFLIEPLAALEAHRHFAAIPDLDRAREFARFGAATLLECGRQLSIAGRSRPSLFADAARAYDVVLQLDEETRRQGGQLGERPVAYARHYRHYNRYRAGLESRPETIAGYERALAAWPDNALFWSRYTVALFVDGRYTEAIGAICNAYCAVPPHPERDRVLRARTTAKLLRRGAIDAALLAWDDHRAGILEGGAERDLFVALERGFTTERLRSRRDAVVFQEPQIVRFARTSKSWIARALDETGHGAYPAAAYEELVETIRREASRLHRTPTHQLDAADRMRKKRLLGFVDLAASRLLELEGRMTWVFGRVTQAESSGALVFRTEDVDLDLNLPGAPALAAEASYRFGRVRTGEAGQPIGPVLEIEEPVGTDPALVWEQWKKRISGNG